MKYLVIPNVGVDFCGELLPDDINSEGSKTIGHVRSMRQLPVDEVALVSDVLDMSHRDRQLVVLRWLKGHAR